MKKLLSILIVKIFNRINVFDFISNLLVMVSINLLLICTNQLFTNRLSTFLLTLRRIACTNVTTYIIVLFTKVPIDRYLHSVGKLTAFKNSLIL